MLSALSNPIFRTAALAVFFMVAVGVTYWTGRTDGARIAEMKSLKSTAKQYRERIDHEQDVYGLSSHDLCIELGGLSDNCPH